MAPGVARTLFAAGVLTVPAVLVASLTIFPLLARRRRMSALAEQVSYVEKAANKWRHGEPYEAQALIWRLKERAQTATDPVSRYAPAALASVLGTLLIAEPDRERHETKQASQSRVEAALRLFRDALVGRNSYLVYRALTDLEQLAYGREVSEKPVPDMPMDSRSRVLFVNTLMSCASAVDVDQPSRACAALAEWGSPESKRSLPSAYALLTDHVSRAVDAISQPTRICVNRECLRRHRQQVAESIRYAAEAVRRDDDRDVFSAIIRLGDPGLHHVR